eukprot:3102848-Rhodomonas_salina.1
MTTNHAPAFPYSPSQTHHQNIRSLLKPTTSTQLAIARSSDHQARPGLERKFGLSLRHGRKLKKVAAQHELDPSERPRDILDVPALSGSARFQCQHRFTTDREETKLEG